MVQAIRWKLMTSKLNLKEVLALLNHSELLHFKPDFQEWRLGLFVPFICIDIHYGPHYSQPSGNYHSKGWNHSSVLRTHDCTFIHTYKEVQSRKSTPKGFSLHDHKRAYACAYATIHFNIILNTYRLQWITTAIDYNNCKPVQATMNCNRTQVQCEQQLNNTWTEPNNEHIALSLHVLAGSLHFRHGGQSWNRGKSTMHDCFY